MTDKGKLICEYLGKFQDLPTLTVSKLIYSQHNLLFKDVEEIRSKIRYYRGNSGERAKMELKDKTFVRPSVYNFPKAVKTNYSGYIVPVSCKKTLVLADLHIPYQDNDSLSLIMDYAQDIKIDSIILLGDIIDCYQLSSFTKDPKQRNFKEEITACKQVFKLLRKVFPKAHIMFREGTHEARYERYLMSKAPEIFGFEEFELKVLLKLHDYKIDYIKNKRVLQYGHLNMLHGDEYNAKTIVNPARAMFMKAKECVLSAHHHQTSQHTEVSLNGKQISTWSIGCLCDLHPEYAPYNNWNHGFAFLERDENNDFMVENKRIVKGKIY